MVGAAGLGRALAILALARAISLLTSLSLFAIATNRKVRGGGDYYLISWSLGIDWGGALGLLLFAAQSISVAFYCVGFGEAVAAVAPGSGPETVRVAAGAAALVLGAIAFVGADLATRFQYAIMAVLAAGLASFYAGGFAAFEPARLGAALAAPSGGPGFWALFALFFLAATGFTQGVSMSGDLRDPPGSLPRGTLAAVGLSAVVYASAMLVLAGALPGDALREDYGAIRRVAAVRWLVGAGLMAAALSPALASFLGAPRILQAIAADGVFRWLGPFARGHGAGGNPRRGVLLTGGVALVTLAAGNSNSIAALISMFFLILLRPLELRHLRRGDRREPVVPAALRLLPRPGEPRRRAALRGGDAGDRPARRARRRGDPGGGAPVREAHRGAERVARQPLRVPLPAREGGPARARRQPRRAARLAAARAGLHGGRRAARADRALRELDHRRLGAHRRGAARRSPT